MLSFEHHWRAAPLPDDQRAMLIVLAEASRWSTRRLVKERDKLLGKEKIPLADFDAKYPTDKKPDRG